MSRRRRVALVGLALAAVAIALALVTPRVRRTEEKDRRDPASTAYRHDLRSDAPRPVRTRTLRGTVVADDGPVRGARVTVSNAFGTGARGATSDASGRFSIELVGDDLWIAASSPDHGAIIEPVSRDAIEMVLRLPGCASALHGSIVDASGGPIVGAVIQPLDASVSTAILGRDVPGRLRRGDSAAMAGAESREDGQYRLCVWPGKLTVVVHAFGYARLASDETVVGQVRRDFKLVPAVALEGTAVGPDGAPIAGATVELAPRDADLPLRAPNRQALSGALGEFKFEELLPGEYVVRGYARGLVADLVPVSAIADREPLVLRFAARPSVEGIVLRGDRPLAQAIVTIRSVEVEQSSRPVATDEQGRFVAEDAPIGRAEIDVTGYKVETPASLAVSGSITGLVVHVRSKASVSGKVVREEHPVARALVFASGTKEKPLKALSEADGSFTIIGLAPGRYVLQADSDAEQAFSSDASKVAIELNDGEERSGIVLTLDGGARIEGHVRGQDDQPIAGAAVSAVDRETSDLCLAETGANGAFSCGKLAGDARYSLSVRISARTATAYKVVRGPDAVDVPRGGVATAELVVEDRRGAIRGRVVDESGAAAPDVIVTALEQPRRALIATDITDEAGRFTLPVAAGPLHVVAARDAKGAQAVVAGIQAGPGEQTIRLVRGSGLRGTLRGFPATGTKVTYVRLGGRDMQEAFVSGATFTASGVVAGDYAVIAQGGGASDAAIVRVMPAATAEIELAARPTVNATIRVVDFASRAGVAGARCRTSATVEGIYLFGTAATIIGTTGPDGTLQATLPRGRAEVNCDGQYNKQSNGLAVVTGGDGLLVTVLVVLTNRAQPHHSIGAALGTPFDTGVGTLSQILELRRGGSAEQAGLHVGDLVLEVDGASVAALTSWGVSWLIGDRPIGDRATLAVRRGAGPAAAVSTVKVAIEPDWSDH